MTGTIDSTAPVATDLSVQVVTGDPLVSRSLELYRSRLAEAGVPDADSAVPPQQRPTDRTSFHVVIDGEGTAVGVLHATVGKLAELSLDPIIDPEHRLSGVVCECPSIAVAPGAPPGVTELLYRSVYCFARRREAVALAAAVDPSTLDILRDEYGFRFRALGRPVEHLGFEMLAVGEELGVLENALAHARPDFFSFLTEPFTSEERSAFGLTAYDHLLSSGGSAPSPS